MIRGESRGEEDTELRNDREERETRRGQQRAKRVNECA